MAAGGVDIGSLMAGLGAGGGGMMGGMTGGQGHPMMGGGGNDAAQDQGIPDLLQQAIDALHQAFSKENDPLDKQAIGKALVAVQAILAQEQKEKDQAMGGGNLRMLRRNR